MKRTSNQNPNGISSWVASVREDSAVVEGLGYLAKVDPVSAVKLAKSLADGTEVDEASEARKLRMPLAELVKGFRALTSFFLNFPSRGLKPEDAIKALVNEGVITFDVGKKITPLIRKVSVETSLPKIIRQKGDLQALTDPALPRLRGVWTRCLWVASFDPEYKSSDTPSAYAPKVRGFVPLVSVQLDLDVFGTVERFSVGLSQGQLKDLANRLQLAGKQLEAMLTSTKARPIEEDEL